MRGRVHLRDLWVIVAILFAALGVLNVAGVAILLFRGPRRYVFLAPASLLVDYWVMMGAWLRTTWGRPAPGTLPPAGPPVLSVARARTLILIAGACVAAVGVALAIQLELAR